MPEAFDISEALEPAKQSLSSSHLSGSSPSLVIRTESQYDRTHPPAHVPADDTRKGNADVGKGLGF